MLKTAEQNIKSKHGHVLMVQKGKGFKNKARARARVRAKESPMFNPNPNLNPRLKPQRRCLFLLQ